MWTARKASECRDGGLRFPIAHTIGRTYGDLGFRLNGDVGYGQVRGRMPYQVCIRVAYRRTVLETYIDNAVGFRGLV